MSAANRQVTSPSSRLQMMRALGAEFAKLKRSRVLVWTMLAVPAYLALSVSAMPYLSGPEGASQIAKAGGIGAQAVEAGLYEPTWSNYLIFAPQMVAGGLALPLFAAVAAYVFGWEFKHSTVASVLTAPVRREYVALSKLTVCGVWLLGLALLMFAGQAIALSALDFDGFSINVLAQGAFDTITVTLLLFLTMPVFAWLALRGKGFLRPMLVSIVITSMGSPLATTEASRYFPWNMPLHVVGAAWLPIPPSELILGSWLVVLALFLAGSAGMVRQMNRTEVV